MNYQISQKSQIITDSIFINTKQITFIKDSEEERKYRIRKHVKADDYFGTLATIFSLMVQDDNLDYKNTQIIAKIIEDLMYLQNNYKIIKK
ncbi:hypothetical protein A2331_06520 [Candidatus Falkowbacteria bacterium RIFOXYB2_FULL_34_18]|uniref:Uncharacterized protein n=1 Tax=Candidatus Falkowbacteria bacterium RIFOXYD2_FULL_34_120 TaxID=1798007 RepID=A0A1F5TRM1_9BACT|nr:MAG: hypothetical protein A2331_06520 [Candidatus Falkowbacteria bacterium RIFOXYB2_FULL_34_18]OGF36636.1 MAG: hypothetical protein A2466_03440 [Candidatus Falkowbacteria bacterium RIFOXYC2_FULL_34_220]OGF39289.1 MAG: hypothetical protein A2515_01905 [Candidatus Falkowbacteria bacterium RIFOXYD12_FULL_34_57]OGF41427.1 MAG: hypothetical protein A2531_00070 [Candidatus Falkowbacteria bacterium RIFOXYD2_FULL_34_120]